MYSQKFVGTYLPTPRYDWDADGRLRKVTGPTGAETTYRYDPLGRRIEKSGPAGTKRYGYGLDHNPLVESDANGPVAAFTFGQGLDSPLAMERGSETGYYQPGGLSTVTSLSRSDGSLRNRYSYGAFGQPQAGAPTDNPFTYTGREWDAESSTYHYRARQMDPQSGRFTSEDPLFAANLYPYADSNPVAFNDPHGLSPFSDVLGSQVVRDALWGAGISAAARFLQCGGQTDAKDLMRSAVGGGLGAAYAGWYGRGILKLVRGSIVRRNPAQAMFEERMTCSSRTLWAEACLSPSQKWSGTMSATQYLRLRGYSLAGAYPERLLRRGSGHRGPRPRR